MLGKMKKFSWKRKGIFSVEINWQPCLIRQAYIYLSPTHIHLIRQTELHIGEGIENNSKIMFLISK